MCGAAFYLLPAPLAPVCARRARRQGHPHTAVGWLEFQLSTARGRSLPLLDSPPPTARPLSRRGGGEAVGGRGGQLWTGARAQTAAALRAVPDLGGLETSAPLGARSLAGRAAAEREERTLRGIGGACNERTVSEARRDGRAACAFVVHRPLKAAAYQQNSALAKFTAVRTSSLFPVGGGANRALHHPVCMHHTLPQHLLPLPGASCHPTPIPRPSSLFSKRASKFIFYPSPLPSPLPPAHSPSPTPSEHTAPRPTEAPISLLCGGGGLLRVAQCCR